MSERKPIFVEGSGRKTHLLRTCWDRWPAGDHERVGGSTFCGERSNEAGFRVVSADPTSLCKTCAKQMPKS